MENKYEIPFGSIVSWSIPPSELSGLNKLFDYGQNFFTKKKETHSSIILDQRMYYLDPETTKVENVWYEFEASTTTRIIEFDAINPHCEVFSINAPREVLVGVYNELKKYSGRPYAVVQVLYFIFRWFFELFKIDTRRWWNPLGFFFLICSELVYIFIKRVAEILQWGDLLLYLNKWRKDNVHSGDIRDILQFMLERNYVTKRK